MGMMPVKLLKVVQVARMLQVSTARVYELVRHKIIPSVRLGRQLRIDDTALRKWIASGGKALPGEWRYADPSEGTTRKRSERIPK